MINWNELDWNTLKRIRQTFLDGGEELQHDYWHSAVDLQNYDATFGQRIGWKWDAVLRESISRGLASWSKKPTLFDWGCGTGIAARKILRFYGADSFESVTLYDRSRIAASYAKELIHREFGTDIKVEIGDAPTGQFVLVASHVLSELDETKKNSLVHWVSQSEASFLVEPGTPKEAAILIEIREALRGHLRIIAPCPHQASCGLIRGKNADDWCHNFAHPPSEIFQDPGWTLFSKRLNIDLRSLPVSFLVLQKSSQPPKSDNQTMRVLGRPRINKIGASFIGCSIDGVSAQTINKRKFPDCFRFVKKNSFTTLIAPQELS